MQVEWCHYLLAPVSKWEGSALTFCRHEHYIQIWYTSSQASNCDDWLEICPEAGVSIRCVQKVTERSWFSVEVELVKYRLMFF